MTKSLDQERMKIGMTRPSGENSGLQEAGVCLNRLSRVLPVGGDSMS